MAIEYGAVLYDPVYAEIGVPATMTVTGADGGAAITVIDDTRPKALPVPGTSGAQVNSVGPGAFARIPELANNAITRDAYLDAVLAFNGRSWIVRSYELRGSPMGEDLGEVRFLLKEAALG
jgi:hypothetical protein